VPGVSCQLLPLMIDFWRHLFRGGNSLTQKSATELARSATQNARELVRVNAALEREIERHMQSLKDLEYERHLFFTLTDNLPEKIFFKDANSRFLRCSKAHLNMFDLKHPNEILGKTDFDFFTEEHANQAFEDEKAVMKTGQPITLEEKETWPDGRVTWALTTKMPFRDKKGNIVGTFGISRDITKRKLMEEELRRLKEGLELLVQQRTEELQAANLSLLIRVTEREQAYENLEISLKEAGNLKVALDEHAIVSITDPQGKITFANNKFCAISKYSREELVGQDHRIINSGFHSKEFIRDLWTTIASGKVWRGEFKNRAKDGAFYWVDTTIVPFLKSDGKPEQYVSIRTDITERKAIEESLEKSLHDKESQLKMIEERAKQNM
jgi:PAS domain S-box-containing protein